MKNIDLRTLTPEARKELKRVAIRLIKSGKNRTKISQEIGIRRETVNNWVAGYRKTGSLGKEKKRGRPMGIGRKLNPKQEELIKKKIVDKTPDQYKLPFCTLDKRSYKIID